MRELSNHTKLMNLILCLSQKNRSCEPVLFNKHYIVETIELDFNKQNGEKINADISLKNPQTNNLLFVECKDGGLELDQAKRYASLDKLDIVTAGVTSLVGDFKHETAYVTSKESKDKLIEGIKKSSLKFPVIAAGDERLKLEQNSFNCPILQEIFSGKGIQLPKDIPVFYYPFSKDDSDAHILSFIGPVLIKHRGQEFDEEDILRSTHNLYEFIDLSSQKSLKSRIGILLNRLAKGDLNNFFDLPSKGKYKLKEFAVKRFNRILNESVSKADEALHSEIQSELKV